MRLGVALLAVGLLTGAAYAQNQPKAAGSSSAQQTSRLTDIDRAIEEFKLRSRVLGLRADSPLSARRKPVNGGRLHGRLFENFRNDLLDATPHELRQRGSDKNLLRRNQFGFNIAGPLVFPKLYNGGRSTFFSVSYEGVRERISRSYLRTVPIGPERAGDFSHTVDSAGQPLPIYDPASTRPNPAFDASQPVGTDNLQYLRDPFPGNVIPRSRLDPVALKALDFYPQANTAVGPFFRNNYFSVNPETNTANGMIVKVDHTINDKSRLEFGTSFSNGLVGPARVFNTIADANPSDRKFTSRRGSITHSYTASARTVHTIEVEASSSVSDSQGETFPAYRFSDGYTAMGRPNPNVRSARHTFEGGNAIATRAANHSLRLATRIVHQQLNTLASAFPAGMFQFDAGITSLPGIVNTGHSFASYLLGVAGRAEASQVLSPSYFRKNRYNLTANDTWEIRKGLTLTVGLNFEVTTPRTEKYDRQSNVDFSVMNPANAKPGAVVFANRDGQGRAFGPVQLRPEPSIGIAWSPAGQNKTVARVSYSRTYEAMSLNGQNNTQGFNAYPTFISPNAQLSPAVVLREGLPVSTTLPDLRPDVANGIYAELLDTSTRMPRYQSVNASLETSIAKSLLLTTGYYHADGRNLFVGNGAANPNAVPLSALEYRDQLNNESFRASLRPYPQYTGFDLNGLYPLGRYQRDAGYARLEKRTSAGLGLSAYYEFAKQMDDYSGPYGTQDFYHRENEWAMTANSNPHRFTLSYVYELPLGSTFLAFSDWRKYVVEGWSLSGMTTLNGGDPLALRPQFNNTGG
ncbi:MAG TPA: hypothetical protein VER03_10175, partial [Bryobacteraceae bacterium]|nr:hypothetical protein [Bryobacteraceae bacterium]